MDSNKIAFKPEDAYTIAESNILTGLIIKNTTVSLLEQLVKTLANPNCFFGLRSLVYDKDSHVLTLKFKHSNYIGTPPGYRYNFQDFLTTLTLKLRRYNCEILNLDVITKTFMQKRNVLRIKLF